MKKALSLIAVLVIASAASAAITVGGTSLDWVKSTAPNGMDSYLVTFSSVASDLITGNDGGFSGAAINNVTLAGQSVYQDDISAFTWSLIPIPPGPKENDSMFLLNVNDPAQVINVAKAESATSLTASFGITAALTSFQARVVVPVGNSFTVTTEVARGDVKDTFSGVVVPEPVTMALLAFGGVGLLARRKR